MLNRSTRGTRVLMQDQLPPPGLPMPPPPNPSGAAPMPTVDRASLRDLAGRQRTAIIAGIVNAVGGVLMYSDAIPAGPSAIFTLVVAGFIIVAAFRLAQHLHGVAIGIVCGIAMLIPFVWIVVLVVLSSKASKQLRAAGVRVGFFGADPSSI
jgi:hypothetical protein